MFINGFLLRVFTCDKTRKCEVPVESFAENIPFKRPVNVSIEC